MKSRSVSIQQADFFLPRNRFNIAEKQHCKAKKRDEFQTKISIVDTIKKYTSNANVGYIYIYIKKDDAVYIFDCIRESRENHQNWKLLI